MSKESLLTLRIIVPGAMVYILLLSLFQQTIDIDSLNTLGSLNVASALFSLLFGALYYVLDRRFKLRAKFNLERRIQNKIGQELVAPFLSDVAIAKAAPRLVKNGSLMDILYKHVDKDESLKERAKEVYMNGILWSSVTDLFILGSGAVMVYFVATLITWKEYYVFLAFITVVLVLFASWAIPTLVAEHIRLTNRQIEYMMRTNKNEVHTFLTELSKEP